MEGFMDMEFLDMMGENMLANMKTTKGTYIYANGDKYVGEWKEHKYFGKGTYFYSNGDKYIGEWKKD